MALFFDAEWFDARLAERWLDREAMAASAQIDRAELDRLFANERAPSAAELQAFAKLLDKDIIEITLRSGISAHSEDEAPATPSARIEDIEARLDAVDAWLEEFENAKKRA